MIDWLCRVHASDNGRMTRELGLWFPCILGSMNRVTMVGALGRMFRVGVFRVQVMHGWCVWGPGRGQETVLRLCRNKCDRQVSAHEGTVRVCNEPSPPLLYSDMQLGTAEGFSSPPRGARPAQGCRWRSKAGMTG
jgi:hypothetical protein